MIKIRRQKQIKKHVKSLTSLNFCMIEICNEKQIKKDASPRLFAHFHLIIVITNQLNLACLCKNWSYVVWFILQK